MSKPLLATLFATMAASSGPSRAPWDVNDFGPMPARHEPRCEPPGRRKKSEAQKRKRDQRKMKKKNRGW